MAEKNIQSWVGSYQLRVLTKLEESERAFLLMLRYRVNRQEWGVGSFASKGNRMNLGLGVPEMVREIR